MLAPPFTKRAAGGAVDNFFGGSRCAKFCGRAPTIKPSASRRSERADAPPASLCEELKGMHRLKLKPTRSQAVRPVALETLGAEEPPVRFRDTHQGDNVSSNRAPGSWRSRQRDRLLAAASPNCGQRSSKLAHRCPIDDNCNLPAFAARHPWLICRQAKLPASPSRAHCRQWGFPARLQDVALSSTGLPARLSGAAFDKRHFARSYGRSLFRSRGSDACWPSCSSRVLCRASEVRWQRCRPGNVVSLARGIDPGTLRHGPRGNAEADRDRERRARAALRD